MESDNYAPCPPPGDPFVSIVEDGFGFYTDPDGNREIIRRYTFTNQNHLTIQVITYGATITSIKYPDLCGVIDDVALGYDDIEGYMGKHNPYMGSIVGRFANRIAKGHFRICEDDYQLSTNIGEHHIHGGFIGFDKVNWKSDVQGNKLVLTYMSKDGEEGYPGEVLVSATYQMTTDNVFMLEMKATTSKATPINLTNHTYFNLAGHAAGVKGLVEHLVSINADRFVTTNEDFIPTGCLQNVTGTMWDLRIARKLGDVLHKIPFGGYDHCMCIHKTDSECMTFNARVVHPESGRTLEIYSNQPGVQFYTANHFPKPQGFVAVTEGEVPDVEVDIKGKNGVHYYKHQAFCLETQNYPDAVNHVKMEAEVQLCPIRVCPICGYVVKDPDFEKPPDECCTDDGSNEKGDGSETFNIVRLIGKDGAEYYYHGAFCLMTEKFPDSVHRKHFPNAIVRPGEMYRHVVHYKFGLFEEVVLEPEDREPPVDEWEGEGEGEGGLFVVDGGDDDLIEARLEENGR